MCLVQQKHQMWKAIVCFKISTGTVKVSSVYHVILLNSNCPPRLFYYNLLFVE